MNRATFLRLLPFIPSGVKAANQAAPSVPQYWPQNFGYTWSELNRVWDEQAPMTFDDLRKINDQMRRDLISGLHVPREVLTFRRL